jgi:hypothetical protein
MFDWVVASTGQHDAKSVQHVLLFGHLEKKIRFDRINFFAEYAFF